MANHHPPYEYLAAFAAGSLPLTFATAVSVHLEHCDLCRVNVQRLKLLAGNYFDDQQSTPGGGISQLKEDVFAKLDGAVDSSAEQLESSSVDRPDNIIALIHNDFEKLNWNSISRSIKSHALCMGEDHSKLSLIKLLPGAKVGTHGHIGEEVTLVLQGSFSDEKGFYQKGDFILRDAADRHNPVASKNGACICLTVEEGPIQFTGMIRRLLNPLLRRTFDILNPA